MASHVIAHLHTGCAAAVPARAGRVAARSGLHLTAPPRSPATPSSLRARLPARLVAAGPLPSPARGSSGRAGRGRPSPRPTGDTPASARPVRAPWDRALPSPACAPLRSARPTCSPCGGPRSEPAAIPHPAPHRSAVRIAPRRAIRGEWKAGDWGGGDVGQDGVHMWTGAAALGCVGCRARGISSTRDAGQAGENVEQRTGGMQESSRDTNLRGISVRLELCERAKQKTVTLTHTANTQRTAQPTADPTAAGRSCCVPG